jgi:hypothetical protein
LPPAAKYILSLDPVKHWLFPLISQIGINYRQGSLSQHDGDEGFKVKAGDRMPYFVIDGQSIFDKLRQPKFHCLVFSESTSDFHAFKTELEHHYAELVDFNFILLNPQLAQIFGTENPFSMVLRPDNHIGVIASETSQDKIKIYLESVLHCP